MSGYPFLAYFFFQFLCNRGSRQDFVTIYEQEVFSVDVKLFGAVLLDYDIIIIPGSRKGNQIKLGSRTQIFYYEPNGVINSFTGQVCFYNREGRQDRYLSCRVFLAFNPYL
jgi:hypothetical protein